MSETQLTLPDAVWAIVFVLPGFVFLEAYRAQQLVRPPTDFAWATKSLAASLVLFALLAAEVHVGQRLCRLPVSSPVTLLRDWWFGGGLLVGAALLGCAMGRVEVVWQEQAGAVRRVLFGTRSTASPDPWYDFLDEGETLLAWVITCSGPNYFGTVTAYSRDPSSDNRELRIEAPAPRDSDPRWAGPVLLNDELRYLLGFDDPSLSDAGGPVWVASSNVAGVIVCDRSSGRQRAWLERHWPWMLALVFLGAWPVIGGTLCTP